MRRSASISASARTWLGAQMRALFAGVLSRTSEIAYAGEPSTCGPTSSAALNRYCRVDPGFTVGRMTTLNNRPNAALLIIDVQNDVMDRVHNRDGVISNIGTLVDKARAEDVPVIWVQHSDEELLKGSPEWQYVSEPP